MNIDDMFEGQDDERHQRRLDTTGFWGARGAGCIMFATATKRYLIAHRSAYVEQPGTWGSWGGAIDRGQSPKAAVRMEVSEEVGYHGPLDLIPLYVFTATKGGKIVFKYFNFVGIVAAEFAPHLNWETEGYRWCEFGDWPTPLHFGLQALLNDPRSLAVLQRLATP